MVEDSPRCSDDDLGAALERLDLGNEANAAVENGQAQPRGLREIVQDAADLQRKLARRYEYESLDRFRYWVTVLDHGQAKRQRLTGACVRLTDHVGAGEHYRD
jgi:hypothetical protein